MTNGDPFHDASPWAIEEADFPAFGHSVDQLRFLVGYAVLAPSGHNAQPWFFCIYPDRIEVFADRTRALPVVDPYDRALVMSCGAAVANLALAAAHFGLRVAIDLPHSYHDDLLATVRLLGRCERDESTEDLFHAIVHRRTNRRPFLDEIPPIGLIERASTLASEHDVHIHWIVDAATKHVLAQLIAEGDRAQLADPRFRRELASWVHSRRSASRDGLSGYAMGMPDVLSPVGALVIRTFDVGKGQAAKDVALAEGSPVLAVFSTDHDEPAQWLATGQAMQKVLLAITAAGFSASFLNQPIEVDFLRPSLALTLGTTRYPQLMIRIGRGPAIEPALRRPVRDVIIEASPPTDRPPIT